MALTSFKQFYQIDRYEVLYKDFMEEVFGDINYQELLLKETNILFEKSVVDPEGSEKTADNDTMGKLHEILFAAHTHNGVDKDGNVTKFPEDTRSKGKKSEDIYKALVKKIGGTSSKAYQTVNNAARDTAQAWVTRHIPNGHKVTVGHWSSQAGDHGRITGVNDKESKADVIIQSEDENGNKHFHPVSLKYTKSDPNLANNGLERISSEAGLSQETGSLSDEWKSHMDRTSGLHGGSANDRSSQYKIDSLVKDAVAKGKDPREAVQKSHDDLIKKQQSEGGLNAKYQSRLDNHKVWLDAHDSEEDKESFIKASVSRAEEADKSKTQALSSIAAKTANSYNIKGDAHIRGSLSKLATPHTVIPHTLAVSYTKDDGSSTPFTTSEHSFAHDHLHQFEHLTATHQGNGVVFYGKHKKTGKTTRVGTLNFKGGNGPYEGANSTLVLHNIMRDTMERQNKNSSSESDSSKEKSEPSIDTSTKSQMPKPKKVASFNQTVVQPNTPTSTKPTTVKPATEPTNNKPKAKPKAYDYKNARGQDLGKLSKGGDKIAQKELQRRQAST